MFRKHLATALAALLAVAACAPCVRAQSGRRFPRAAEDKGFVVLTSEKPDAAKEFEVPERRGKEFDLKGLNAGRQAPVVFAEDGDKHPNKADKIAGAALLGYLIFFIIVTVNSNGYASQGPFTQGAGLRR